MAEKYTISIQNFDFNQGCEKATIDIDTKSIIFFDLYDIKKSNMPVAHYDIHLEQVPSIKELVKFCEYVFGPTESMNKEIYQVQIKNKNKSFDFYVVQDIIKYLDKFKRKQTQITKNDIILTHDLKQIWPRRTLGIPGVLKNMHKSTRQKQ